MSLDTLLWDAVGGKDNSYCEDELKFLFVGGKGGVGKTTSSSAIATLLATRCAKRVLLVSTDPAHSLSDAFRMSFTNKPQKVISNLHVLEVDPSGTMKQELQKWARIANDMAGGSDSNDKDSFVKRLQSLQDWLAGVPGIDEATALGNALRWIESGDYDLIVFDTAPTGHTLKLLQMPEILQQGLDQIQGWQGTLWSYWELFKATTTGSPAAAKKRTDAKAQVATMLEEYKQGIQKVAHMLQDQKRTRFVVVCIAEFLSISETQRLLRELKKNRVRASHIVVNQLVTQDALSHQELAQLEGLAEIGNLHLNQSLLVKTVQANRLTTARKSIQEKYLAQLKAFDETQELLDGICEVPLLAEEVTGVEALQRFGNLMVHSPPSLEEKPSVRRKSGPPYSDSPTAGKRAVDPDWLPQKGDTVLLQGLTKSVQYNNLKGVLTDSIDSETGRCSVAVEHNGATRQLALHPDNLLPLEANNKRSKTTDRSLGIETTTTATHPSSKEGSPSNDTYLSKAQRVLSDPEIKSMIDANPRFAAAVQDVLSNPMNFVKYLMDPEMAPLIQTAMSKL